MYAHSNKILLAILLAFGLGQASLRAQASAVESGSLKIVNTTSVPAISLSIDEANDYPDFPQGKATGLFPISPSSVKYTAVNLANGARAESSSVQYTTGTQTLIIVGDFSTDCPPGELPSGATTAPPEKPYPPNVLFKVFPNSEPPKGNTIRVQVYNAMPRTTLEFSGKSAQRQSIAPGQISVLIGQPRPAFYQAAANGETLNLTLMQTDVENQIVVFFLRNGKPAYTIVSESRFGR